MDNRFVPSARGAVLGLLLAAAAGQAWATLEADVEATLSPKVRQRLASYRPEAMKGDYQAMRNIGLVWATDAAQEQPMARIVGCAWFMAILDVHKQKADASDAGNKRTHCSQLNDTQLAEANGVTQRIKYAAVRR
jgi:hypothetical protein